jgi:hypothetical protein
LCRCRTKATHVVVFNNDTSPPPIPSRLWWPYHCTSISGLVEVSIGPQGNVKLSSTTLYRVSHGDPTLYRVSHGDPTNCFYLILNIVRFPWLTLYVNAIWQWGLVGIATGLETGRDRISNPGRRRLSPLQACLYRLWGPAILHLNDCRASFPVLRRLERDVDLWTPSSTEIYTM